MEELQASLLLVGTHFVASAREHHAGAAATFQVDTLGSDVSAPSKARPPPLVPAGTLLYCEKGTKRVLEYARLAMGFANVRASHYGIR